MRNERRTRFATLVAWLWAWHVGHAFAAPPEPPSVGAPFAVDRPVADPASVRAAALGSNGDGFLVAWIESFRPELTVLAAPVDANGTVGARVELSLPDTPWTEAPVVAASGPTYLVAWIGAPGDGTAHVFARTFEPTSGAVGPALDLGVTPSIAPPVVAASAGTFFVAFALSSSSAGFVRVGRDGAVLDPAPIPLPLSNPSGIAPTDDGVLVVSSNSFSRVRAARIGADGTVRDPAGFDVASVGTSNVRGTEATVARAGDHFVVAWNEDTAILGTRVGLDGSVLDAVPFTIATSSAASPPALASTSTGLVATWTATDVRPWEVRSAALDIDGRRRAPADVVLSTNVGAFLLASVASDGTTTLATWLTYTSVSSTLVASRLGDDASPIDAEPRVLALDSNQQHRPTSASDGTGFLVVWWDERIAPPGRGLYAARVRADGTRLDPDAIHVTSDPSVTWDVASNGSEYLVVWNARERNVRAARVSSAGELLDPDGIDVVPTQTERLTDPRVAAGDSDFFVVWGDDRAPGPTAIAGARIAADGTVRDTTSLAIAASDAPAFAPAVTWTGTAYYVAWVADGLFGARVDPSGTVLDANAVRLASPYGVRFEAPMARSNGSETLIAWADDASDGDADLFGVLVGNDGRAVSPIAFPILQRQGNQSAVAIVPHDSEFVVAWCDGDPVHPGARSVRGTRIDSRGRVRDVGGFAIVDGGVLDDLEDLAIDREGNVLVATSVDLHDPAETGRRVRARTVALPPVERSAGCDCSVHGRGKPRPLAAFTAIALLALLVRRSRSKRSLLCACVSIATLAGCHNDDPVYQAFWPDVPVVLHSDPSIVATTPRIVPVFFSDTRATEALEDFVHRYATSSAWRESVGEYGVGETRVGGGVFLPYTAATTVAPDGTIDAWLSAAYATDGAATWGTQTGWELYLFFFPDGSDSFCAQGGTWHGTATIGQQGSLVVFVADCGHGLDAITEATSAALVDAVTVPGQPWGYEGASWPALAYLQGDTLATMCAPRPGVRYTPSDVGYSIVHTWSNELSLDHLDPCRIIPAGHGYFASSPVFDVYPRFDLPKGGYSFGAGVFIPVGASRTIDVELWSDGPTSGPWNVSAEEVGLDAPTLAFAWDETSGSNGDVRHLTITAVAPAPRGAVFRITSALGEARTYSVGVVANPP